MSEITVYRKDSLRLREDAAGARFWAVGLDKSMLTYFEMAPGTAFPGHSHDSEQITLVLEGEIDFSFGGRTVTLRPGDVIAIPANEPHSARTRALACRAVDAWSPPRAAFLEKA
jgi:quercetin dioxygenase-like cupin family protein